MPTLTYVPLFLNGSVIQLGCKLKATDLSDAVLEAQQEADKDNKICLLYEEIGRIQTAFLGIREISYKLKKKIAPKNNSELKHVAAPAFYKWTTSTYENETFISDNGFDWELITEYNQRMKAHIPLKQSVIFSDIFEQINLELAHVHVQGDFELQLSFAKYNPLLMPTIYRVAKLWCKKWNKLRSQFQNKHEVEYHEMGEEVHFNFRADDDEYDDPHISIADDEEITVDDLPEEESSSEEE
jgi:hypothetical protein